MPENVTYGNGYIRYIKSKKQTVLSEQQVQTIIKQVETGRYPPTLKTQRKHVKYVKNITSKNTKNNNKNKIICPKCDGEMVLRTAKKGKNVGSQFWGCEHYPKCRGTLDYKK